MSVASSAGVIDLMVSVSGRLSSVVRGSLNSSIMPLIDSSWAGTEFGSGATLFGGIGAGLKKNGLPAPTGTGEYVLPWVSVIVNCVAGGIGWSVGFSTRTKTANHRVFGGSVAEPAWMSWTKVLSSGIAPGLSWRE